MVLADTSIRIRTVLVLVMMQLGLLLVKAMCIGIMIKVLVMDTFYKIKYDGDKFGWFMQD